MKLFVASISLAVSTTVLAAFPSIPIYQVADIPVGCVVIAHVSDTQWFGADAPEQHMPRRALEPKVMEACRLKAAAVGADAFVYGGVTIMDGARDKNTGKRSFGYECRGIALKC